MKNDRLSFLSVEEVLFILDPCITPVSYLIEKMVSVSPLTLIKLQFIEYEYLITTTQLLLNRLLQLKSISALQNSVIHKKPFVRRRSTLSVNPYLS